MHPVNKKLSFYERGATSMFACQYDQRFSFCAYIPQGYKEEEDTAYPLAVVADVAIRRLYVRETLGESVEISGEAK